MAPKKKRRATRKPKKARHLLSHTLAPIAPAHAKKYEHAYAAQAQKLCELGATDRELADFFEVSTVAIWHWQARYPAFFAALKRGKEAADDRVERALYSRATGYTFESEKILVVEGEVVREGTVEHVPPDVTACIFWLKNRRSSEWRDAFKIDHDHQHKLNLQGGSMTIEQAQDIFRQARSMSAADLEKQFKLIDGRVEKTT